MMNYIKKTEIEKIKIHQNAPEIPEKACKELEELATSGDCVVGQFSRQWDRFFHCRFLASISPRKKNSKIHRIPRLEFSKRIRNPTRNPIRNFWNCYNDHTTAPIYSFE